jgi:hypothetical protein
VFKSAAGRAVWLVEYKDERGFGDEFVPKRALLYKPSGKNQWSLALRASDDDGHAWASVAAQTADVAKDGNPKAIYSIRPRTGNTTLAIEVVEASGDVVVHVKEDRVVARLHPDGGIEYWFRDAAGWNHRLIRYQQGAWRIVVSERVDGPPSFPPTSPGRL